MSKNKGWTKQNSSSQKKSLPPELKERWVEALRSGEYSQGQHRLCVERDGVKNYCCLGVLLDVEKGHDAWNERRNEDDTIEFGFREEYGSSNFGGYGYDFMETLIIEKLMKMNDSGKSFEEIADWIKENL